MAAYTTTLNWLQQHMLACPSKKLFFLDCPGCGLQRSLLALLRGDIAASWHLYPPALFILSTLLFLPVHLYLDLKHGAFILKCLYIVSVIAILINYIYKISTNQLL